MTAKKKYTHESVQRALVVHETRGVVRTWSPPEVGRPKYRVNLYEVGHWEGTLKETYALLAGIRAEQVWSSRDSD